MKKTIKFFAILAVLLFAVSCQESGLDNGQAVKGGKLNLTATIVTPDASRVTYDVDNETTHTITPSWTVGDKIIGFDDEGVTFTFEVASLNGDHAVLDDGGYVPGSATKLYAIYAPGKLASDISANTLSVDLGTQSGELDEDSPVLMCATAAITGSDVTLDFENQTAIIGVTKFKLPAAATLTSISVDGLITSGTFEVDGGGNLVLTPASAPATATATGSWATGAEDICETAIYFATLPTAGAKIALRASDGVNDYGNLASIAATDVVAGNYYYMNKTLGAPVADVNGVKYGTIDDAWAAANRATSATTITLLADCTSAGMLSLNSAASGTGAVTLDLNGQTLTVTPTGTKGIEIDGSRSLTVRDGASGGKIESSAQYMIYATGTAPAGSIKQFILQSGSLNGTYTGSNNSTALHLITKNGGHYEITGGSISATNTAYRGIYLGNESTLDVYDLTVNTSAYCVYVAAGTINLKGGAFTRTGTYCVYSSDESSEANISAGTYTHTSSGNPLIYAYKGVINVTGGCFEAVNVRPVNCAGTSASDGVAYVTGGRFNKPLMEEVLKDDSGNEYINVHNTDEGTKATYPFAVSPESSTHKVAGLVQGSFTWDFGTIEGAMKGADVRAKANGNSIVTLTNDDTATSTMSISDGNTYSVTLDLAGHVVSSTASTAISSAGAFVLQDSDSGGELATTGSVALEVTAGEATVNGGSLYGASNAATVASGASLIINGGHFWGNGTADIIGTGTTTAYGGYYRYNPTSLCAASAAASGVTESFGGRTYNYQVVDVVATVNGEGYSTLAAAADAAVKYAGTSATVTLQLQRNIEHNGTLDLSHATKQIILDLNNCTLSSSVTTFITTSKNLLITDLSLEAGGKITSSKSQIIYTDSDHHGTIVVEKVLIACTYGPSGTPEYTDADRYVITCRNGTNMTIRNGVRIDQYSSGKNQVCGIMLGGASTLTIEDAEIVTFNRYAIYTNNANASLTIGDNSLMYSGKMQAVYVNSVKEVSITGGYYYSGSDSETLAVVAANGSTQGGKVTITGGFYNKPLTNSDSLTGNAHCPDAETVLSNSSFVNNATGWTYTSKVLNKQLTFNYAVNPASIP